MTKKQKPKAPSPTAFDREFRDTAVKLALAGTKSIAEVARELGLPAWKLYGWVNASKEKSGTSSVNSTPGSNEEAAYLNLQKRYRELEQENEILKKAAAYFARNQK